MLDLLALYPSSGSASTLERVAYKRNDRGKMPGAGRPTASPLGRRVGVLPRQGARGVNRPRPGRLLAGSGGSAQGADRDRTAPDRHRYAAVVHTTGAEEISLRADESSTAAEKNRFEGEQNRIAAEQSSTAAERSCTAPAKNHSAADQSCTAPDKNGSAANQNVTAAERFMSAAVKSLPRAVGNLSRVSRPICANFAIGRVAATSNTRPSPTPPGPRRSQPAETPWRRWFRGILW